LVQHSNAKKTWEALDNLALKGSSKKAKARDTEEIAGIA
jgi:hypothetical protein